MQSKKDPWQHILDTCTRYSQAKIVTIRAADVLLKGLQDLWINPFGPPKVLETDREGGLITENAK
eukprot:12934765-Prorocentrum_lima.AAC.1